MSAGITAIASLLAVRIVGVVRLSADNFIRHHRLSREGAKGNAKVTNSTVQRHGAIASLM